MTAFHRKNRVASFLRDNGGATAIEYVLIIAGLAFVVLGSVNFIGDSIEDKLHEITAKMTGQPVVKVKEKDDKK